MDVESHFTSHPPYPPLYLSGDDVSILCSALADFLRTYDPEGTPDAYLERVESLLLELLRHQEARRRARQDELATTS